MKKVNSSGFESAQFFAGKGLLFLKRWAFLFFLSFIVFSSGCKEDGAGKGIVATVNGRPVFFNELEAQRNSLFPHISSNGTITGDTTQLWQYRYALQQLIVQELATQYLQKHNIAIEDTVKESEAAITADYLGDSFSEALVEDGISRPVLSKMITRSAAVQTLMDKVLRQDIVIESSEVEAFFEAHKKDFIIPEQWHFLLITGKDKLEVKGAGEMVLVGKDAATVQKEHTVDLRDVRMDKIRLPEETSALLAKTPQDTLSDLVYAEGLYKGYIVFESIPQTQLEPTEIYRRVERTLLEDKMQLRLSGWVEKTLSRAHISIAPQLLTAEVPFSVLDSAPSVNGTDASANASDSLDESDVQGSGDE